MYFYMHMYTIEPIYTYTEVFNNKYYYIKADHPCRFQIKYTITSDLQWMSFINKLIYLHI